MDGTTHTRSSDYIAIVSLAEIPEFFIIPRPIVSNNISDFQWLALKVRSV
jgi:hypothetical protein